MKNENLLIGDNKITLKLLVDAVLVSIVIIIFGISLMVEAIVSNYWPLIISLPIPVLALILGIKLKKSNIKYINDISRFVSIVTILLIIIATIMMIGFSKYEKQDYNYIYDLESKIGIDFPNQGRIITKDFSSRNPNSVRYTKLSRVYFEKDINEFENMIKTSDQWIEVLNEDLKKVIPKHLQSEAEYNLLYNITRNTFNDKTLGDYKYILVYYYGNGETSIVEYGYYG